MSTSEDSAKSISCTAETSVAPVRVGVERLTAASAKAYPMDGDGKIWWSRLKAALGTRSSDFVNASLAQLTAAARLPGSGISLLQ